MNIFDPTPYDEDFEEAAKKYGIPSDILKSIAHKESTFNPDAEGDKDLANTPLGSSAGMFQFRRGTGQDYGLVDPKTGRDDRKDPKLSANAAAKKLSDDLQYFKGDLRLAIEAFNGGRGNAGKSDQTFNYASDIFSKAIQTNFYKNKQQVSQAPSTVQDQTEKLEESEESKNTKKELDAIKDFYKQNNIDYKYADTTPKDTAPDYTKDVPVDQVHKVDPRSIEDIQYVFTDHKVKPKPITKEQARDLTSDNNFNTMRNYLIGRLGVRDNPFLKLEFANDEATREKVADLFLSHMRKTEFNTSFGGVPELAYLYNASNRDVLFAAKAHELYEAIPNFWEKDTFAEGVESFGVGFARAFTDPSSWLGVGVGTFVKYKLARQGIKEALKIRLKAARKDLGLKKGEKLSKEKVDSIRDAVVKEKKGAKIKGIVAGAGVEGAVGIGMSAVEQNIDIKLQRTVGNAEILRKQQAGIITKEEANVEKAQLIVDTKVSKGEMAAMGIVSAGLGSIGAAAQIVSFKGLKPQLITEEDAVGSLTKYKVTLAERAKDLERRSKLPVDHPDYKPYIPMDVNMEKVAASYASLINQTDFKTVSFNLTEEQLKLLDSKKINKQIDDLKKDPTLYNKLINVEKTKDGKGFKYSTTLRDLEKIDPLLKDLKTKQGAVVSNLKTKGIIDAAKIETDAVKKSLAVAFNVLTNSEGKYLESISGFIHKKQQIGDVLTTVAQDIGKGKIDATVLSRSLSQAGIDEKDLVKMRVDTSELARNFNFSKQIADGVRSAVTLDPELQKIYDLKYAKDINNKQVSFVGAGLEFIKRGERETKALVVASIGTTIRNIYGTTIGITLDSAARILDAGLYTGVKIFKSTVDGRYSNIGYGKGIMSDGAAMIQEQGLALSHFAQQNMLFAPFNLNKRQAISNQFDLILKDDYAQRNLLLTSLQEVGEHSLSKFSRTANAFNLAQDAFFRRGIFVQSVKRQLMRAGMDVEDLLAQNRKVPIDIIKTATDEALEGTFSKVPKIGSEDLKNLDVNFKSGEHVGNYLGKVFINTMEKIPFSTLAITFPRFMVNAAAFQYRYSIMQPLKSGQKFYDGFYNATIAKKRKLKQFEENAELERRNKLDPSDPDYIKDGYEADPKSGYHKGIILKDKERIMRIHDEATAMAYQEATLAMARGTAGVGMLYGALEYRRSFGEDTAGEFYNLKVPGGGTIDTRAIFPIAPFLAIADFVYKYETSGKQPDTKEILKAVTGLKLAGGGQANFPLLDDLVTMTKEDLLNSDKVYKMLGDGLANIVGRVVQPFQPFISFADLVSEDAEQFAKARDPKTLDSTGSQIILERAYKRLLLRAGGALSETFFDIADTASFGLANYAKQALEEAAPHLAVSKRDLPKALNKFSDRSPSRPGEFFNLIQGFREVPRIGQVEREFRRLEVNIWSTYQLSGDEKLDREIIIESLNSMVGDSSFIKGIIDDDLYKKSSDLQRAYHLKQNLSLIVTEARKKALANLADGNEDQLIRFANRQLRSMDKDLKKLMIQAFNKDRGEKFDKNNKRHIMDLFEYEHKAFMVSLGSFPNN